MLVGLGFRVGLAQGSYWDIGDCSECAVFGVVTGILQQTPNILHITSGPHPNRHEDLDFAGFRVGLQFSSLYPWNL